MPVSVPPAAVTCAAQGDVSPPPVSRHFPGTFALFECPHDAARVPWCPRACGAHSADTVEQEVCTASDVRVAELKDKHCKRDWGTRVIEARSAHTAGTLSVPRTRILHDNSLFCFFQLDLMFTEGFKHRQSCSILPVYLGLCSRWPSPWQCGLSSAHETDSLRCVACTDQGCSFRVPVVCLLALIPNK